MNIQSINNSTNFKSTYPVVHWVAETNGSFAPVANLQIVKKLQGKIVRVLNKALNETKKPFRPSEQKLRAYIGSCDIDYRNLPELRSFYNREEGSITEFSPVSYIISGKDQGIFEEDFAKIIGTLKSEMKEQGEDMHSPEVLAAIKTYNKEGLKFVNDTSRRIKDKKGITYVLHTKFEIIRNKLGKIKDYNLIDARFLPEYGPNSPFERLKK